MLNVAGWRIKIRTEKIPEVEFTKSGIALPKDAVQRRAVDKGTVAEVGALCWKDQRFNNCEPWCKVGDRVLFVRYAGNEQEDPETGVMYTLVNDEDILGTLSREDLKDE